MSCLVGGIAISFRGYTSTLLILSRLPAYASDIISQLKEAKLIVVEGTLYPLLARLKNAGFLEYSMDRVGAGPSSQVLFLDSRGSGFSDFLGGSLEQYK